MVFRLSNAELDSKDQRRHFGGTSFGIVDQVVFFDEKLFIIEEHLNAQNFRVYAGVFEDITERVRDVQRFQKPGFGGKVQTGQIFPGSCRMGGDSKCCVLPGGNL
jgi:hypothetical protein